MRVSEQRGRTYVNQQTSWPHGWSLADWRRHLEALAARAQDERPLDACFCCGAAPFGWLVGERLCERCYDERHREIGGVE